MEAQALATLGLAGPPAWADASRVIYASGNGLVSHDVQTGSQTHLWGTANKGLGGSAGVPVYAVCAARQLVAVAQNGVEASIQLVSASDFHLQASIKEPSKDAGWQALALSADGSKLAGVGSYPDHWLDVWDTDPALKEPKGKASLSGGPGVGMSIARMRLGPRLARHTPVFFPLNPGVVVVAGEMAARVVVVEKMLGGHRLHQADVDLGVLSEDETLSSVAWSATGALLLGTSAGRLLGVEGAAPTAIKEQGWGMGAAALVATLLFSAPANPALLTGAAPDKRPPVLRLSSSASSPVEEGPEQPSPLGSVVAVFCLPAHLVLVYSGSTAAAEVAVGAAGSAACQPHMLWLQASSLQVAALCPLPGSSPAAHACMSPTLDTILISTLSKELVHAESMYSIVPDDDGGDDAAQQDQSAALLGLPPLAGSRSRNGRGVVKPRGGSNVVAAQVLASFHAGRVGGVVMLPNEMFASGGEDGRLRLWQCTLGVTSAGGLVPQANDSQSGPRFALGVTLVASWQLSAPITILCNYMGGPLIMAGTASGEVHVFNSNKVNILVGSGSLIHLPAFIGSVGVMPAVAAATNASAAEVEDALAPMWAQRPFDHHPVTSIAVSGDGHMCAMSSAAQGVVAFYRVVSISKESSEVALHLLGFYAVTSPQMLAWGPKDTSSTAYPHLLVVSTTNGELQVLRPPDSLGHLKQAGALVPNGSLLVGLLRASSIITAMVTTPAAASGIPAEAGTFWLFACCMDKSVRRIRLPTEQHKSTARTGVESAIQRQDGNGNQRRGSITSGLLGQGMQISAPQNFQIPETEKPQELTSPACHASLSTSGKQLTVSTLCGTTYVYTLPELSQLIRWPMHAPLPVEETSLGAPQAVYSATTPDLLLPAPPPGPATVHTKAGAAALGSRLLASVGVDGCVQVVELQVEEAGAQGRGKPVLPASGRASPSHNLRRAYGNLAPSARMSAPPGLGSVVAGAGAAPARPPYLAVLDAAPRRVLTWQQAQAAMQAHTIAQELRAASDKVSKRSSVWQQQLQDLKARNLLSEEGERLHAEEFVMDRALQAALLREGEDKVAGVRAASLRACVEPQVVRTRLGPELLSCTEPAGNHQILAPLAEHTFTSPVAGEDMKRWREASTSVAAVLAGGVTSYAVRALTPQEKAQLRKVTCLRRVEQAELQERPKENRGQVTTIKRWRGQMATRIDLSTLVASSSASLQPTPRDAATGSAPAAPPAAPAAADAEEDEEEEDGSPKKKVDDDNIEGNEVENGLCGLLYAPLQLHCPTRKAAQAVLLMEEVRATQRAFNARFEKLRARKAADVDKLEERAARVVEIQKELGGLTPARSDFAGLDLESWQETLNVADSEVKVDKWVSPEEAARRAAVAKLEEEARLKAEADDARQRALREMMNATLEVRKVVAEDAALKKEPWMDLPRTQLSADQRKQLTEWEKRSAEVAEEQEKARRALETERKGLEFEMADIIMEFNAQLAALAAAKVKVSIELRVLEMQALDCAMSREGAAAAHGALDTLRGQQSSAINTHEWRRALLSEAKNVRIQAARDYETLSGQERALDKAVKRELGLKDEDMWEKVQRVYKDRARPPRHGVASRSLADILGKLPEAANLATPTPQSPTGQRHSFTGELMPHTCVLEPAPREPPCIMQLTRWLTSHTASTSTAVQDGAAAVDHILQRLEGIKHERASQQINLAMEANGGAQPASRVASPATKQRPGTGGTRTSEPGLIPTAGFGEGSALAGLLQVLGNRPLGNLLDVMVEGRSVRSLMPTALSEGLVPPDTQSDPYQSPLAQAVFGPAGPLPTPEPPSSSQTQTPQPSSPLPPRPGEAADRSGSRQAQSHAGVAPYTLADKPHDMEDAWWLRLMDMRDARIGLEKATDASWSQLAWASLTCDMLTAEQHASGGDLGDLSEALATLPHVVSRSLLDVLMVYRITNGQVEVPCAGDEPLSAMAPATLVHRWQVEQRNLAIQESGGEKLGLLRDLKAITAASHLARWGVSRAELRKDHARLELSDLQLLHVTKDLQAVLRDRSALSRMDAAGQMEARISAATASHAARLSLKVEQETRLTTRVAQCMREHQDLEGATHAAHAAADEAKRVRQVIARSVAEEEAAHKRALRAIVANSQLKDIATAQAQEIQGLMAELEGLKTRTFPMLSPQTYQSPGTLAPDLRMPRTPSPSARTAGLGRPGSVPVGKSRPMYGGSPTSVRSRPSSGMPGEAAATLVRATSARSRNGAAGAGAGGYGTAGAGLSALAGAAPGALPPRPGTVATGNRRYDRPSH